MGNIKYKTEILVDFPFYLVFFFYLEICMKNSNFFPLTFGILKCQFVFINFYYYLKVHNDSDSKQILIEQF